MKRSIPAWKSPRFSGASTSPRARPSSIAGAKGCSFPLLSNLFGTLERTRFLFRDTLRAVQHLVQLKVDPSSFWKHPWQFRDVPQNSVEP